MVTEKEKQSHLNCGHSYMFTLAHNFTTLTLQY